jgi:DNA-binding PadR family transcriptional regulator
MTLATQAVLRAALQEPTREFYGAEVGQAAGLPSGTVTPILARLEAAGILESRYEDVDPRQAGRPRRRYYTFTVDGAERARHDLARTHQVTNGRPNPRWKPVGGTAGGAL